MDDKNKKFLEAIVPCPPHIKQLLGGIPDAVKAQTYEIRLRAEKPLVLCGSYGSGFIGEGGRFSLILPSSPRLVTKQELTAAVSKMCEYSLHTYQQDMVDGFITLEGGHRVGICANSVIENGIITAVRDVYSLNIRIARSSEGVSIPIMESVFRDGLKSIIIAGPPSSGKTTVVRDMARQLSSGFGGNYTRVVIADERYEIAAVRNGIAQNPTGINSDVISGFPKAVAVMNALKSMSPEVIVCDEISGEQEIQKIEYGLNSGVKFIITVHASSCAELFRKKQVKSLLATGEFKKIVLLKSGRTPCMVEKIIDTDNENDEIYRDNPFGIGSGGRGEFYCPAAEKTG